MPCAEDSIASAGYSVRSGKNSWVHDLFAMHTYI